MPRPSKLPAHTIIGERYAIGNELGRGGFAIVYTALDRMLGATVAVKHVTMAGLRDEDRALVSAEIDLMARLHHANIVQYKESFSDGNSLFVVMELVEAGSLMSMVKRFGILSESLAAVYTVQMLQGLVYLHEQGVVHRDIKSGNALLTKDGVVKLADFGIAQSGMADEEDVAGSPYWMAPELIEMRGASTPCDIWSLGCTIIELLTGMPPYFHLKPLAALFHIVQDDHPPFPDHISDQLRQFLHRCFHKQPELRGTARDLLHDPWITSSISQAGMQFNSPGSVQPTPSKTTAPAPKPAVPPAAGPGGSSTKPAPPTAPDRGTAASSEHQSGCSSSDWSGSDSSDVDEHPVLLQARPAAAKARAASDAPVVPGLENLREQSGALAAQLAMELVLQSDSDVDDVDHAMESAPAAMPRPATGASSAGPLVISSAQMQKFFNLQHAAFYQAAKSLAASGQREWSQDAEQQPARAVPTGKAPGSSKAMGTLVSVIEQDSVDSDWSVSSKEQPAARPGLAPTVEAESSSGFSSDSDEAPSQDPLAALRAKNHLLATAAAAPSPAPSPVPSGGGGGGGAADALAALRRRKARADDASQHANVTIRARTRSKRGAQNLLAYAESDEVDDDWEALVGAVQTRAGPRATQQRAVQDMPDELVIADDGPGLTSPASTKLAKSGHTAPAREASMQAAMNQGLHALDQSDSPAAMVSACRKLVHIVRERPHSRQDFFKYHGAVRLLMLLNSWILQPQVLRHVLRLVNTLAQDDTSVNAGRVLESMCTLGALPLIMQCASSASHPSVRLQAAIFVSLALHTSPFTLQLLIACDGVSSLVALCNATAYAPHEPGRDTLSRAALSTTGSKAGIGSRASSQTRGTVDEATEMYSDAWDQDEDEELCQLAHYLDQRSTDTGSSAAALAAAAKGSTSTLLGAAPVISYRGLRDQLLLRVALQGLACVMQLPLRHARAPGAVDAGSASAGTGAGGASITHNDLRRLVVRANAAEPVSRALRASFLYVCYVFAHAAASSEVEESQPRDRHVRRGTKVGTLPPQWKVPAFPDMFRQADAPASPATPRLRMLLSPPGRGDAQPDVAWPVMDGKKSLRTATLKRLPGTGHSRRNKTAGDSAAGSPGAWIRKLGRARGESGAAEAAAAGYNPELPPGSSDSDSDQVTAGTWRPSGLLPLPATVDTVLVAQPSPDLAQLEELPELPRSAAAVVQEVLSDMHAALVVLLSLSDAARDVLKDLAGPAVAPALLAVLRPVPNALLFHPRYLPLIFLALKALRNLSTEVKCQESIDAADGLETLVPLLRRVDAASVHPTEFGPSSQDFKSMKYHVCVALHNMCRVNKSRQAALVASGSVPLLCALAASPQPCSSFALQLIFLFTENVAAAIEPLLQASAMQRVFIPNCRSGAWRAAAMSCIARMLRVADGSQIDRALQPLLQPGGVAAVSLALTQSALDDERTLVNLAAALKAAPALATAMTTASEFKGALKALVRRLTTANLPPVVLRPTLQLLRSLYTAAPRAAQGKMQHAVAPKLQALHEAVTRQPVIQAAVDALMQVMAQAPA